MFSRPTATIDEVCEDTCVYNKIGEDGTEYCFENTEDAGGVECAVS